LTKRLLRESPSNRDRSPSGWPQRSEVGLGWSGGCTLLLGHVLEVGAPVLRSRLPAPTTTAALDIPNLADHLESRGRMGRSSFHFTETIAASCPAPAGSGQRRGHRCAALARHTAARLELLVIGGDCREPCARRRSASSRMRLPDIAVGAERTMFMVSFLNRRSRIAAMVLACR